jgi:class 3 adenylate cyclase
MEPADNFHFVQAFTARMGPVIARNGGFVHQYLGDGIMAIFLEGPEKAIQAAVDMQYTLDEYNLERQEVGRIPLRLGIGLHTGPLIMGVIGDQYRSDAATISDTVNSASRMEGLTKEFKAKVLVSAATVTALQGGHPFEFRFLGEVKVKGKQKGLGVYECLNANAEQIFSGRKGTIKEFREGVAAQAKGDLSFARECFEDILAKDPSDEVVRHLLESLPVETV